MEDSRINTYTSKTKRTISCVLIQVGNWTFVYLGANQNSYAVAQDFGIKHGNISNFNATVRGMGQTMNTVAVNTCFFSASGTSSTDNFLSKEDQDKLNSTK